MKLVILVAVMISGCWAGNKFKNPQRENLTFPIEQCYKCNEFNEQGYGYVENPDTTECCSYYECWKVKGVRRRNSLQGELRYCPEGTWFNPGVGEFGAPCTSSKPYAECASKCGPTLEIIHGQCRLWPGAVNPREFGVVVEGVWTKTGRCKLGDKFDRGACTCIGRKGRCDCMLLLDFEGGPAEQDNSCTCGDVYTSGNEVIDNFDTFYGFSGIFDETLLTANVFRGMYAGCAVKKLSVSAWIYSYNPFSTSMQGVVCYSTCEDEDEEAVPGSDASFCISVGQNKVVAELGGYTVEHGPIAADTWLYVAFTYKMRARNNNLKLYVMTVSEYDDCRSDDNLCTVRDSATTGRACIEPRQCGLTVGSDGSNNTRAYFAGEMTQVDVLHGLDIFTC